jgi:flagellar biosynthesis protein FlhF
MRIKTFEAPTVQKALALARTELGENAVVLNTKYAKSGRLLGLRGSDKVELMAAVDGEQMGRDIQAVKMVRDIHVPDPVLADFQVRPPQAASGHGCPGNPARHTDVPGEQGLLEHSLLVPDPHESEINKLRAELKNLSAIVHGLCAGRADAPVLDRPLLMRLGIDEELARGLLSEMVAIDDPAELTSALAARLQAFAIPPSLDGRQVIALVGPTGVGKTTTLAKLAARFSLEQGKSVAMLTADTYRIGAVEQLKTYARIMDVPLEIAFSPEDVAAGVAKHSDKDVILIDTVGRSQRSAEHLEVVREFVDAAKPTQTHLVIAASLAGEIQREAVEKFSAFSPTQLIITKLDESPTRGLLVNLPLGTGLAISCTTAGQNVPQDIDFADAGKIARLVTEVA